MQPHIQTQGLGFLVRSHWLQYVYYFASQLHSSYQAHTQFLCFLWNADFLLKIDLQAVMCRCFAQEFITFLPCTALSHMHAHTYAYTACPQAIPTCRIKRHPFVLEYLRCKQTNAPVGERERPAGRKRQQDKNRNSLRRWRNKQTSRLYDGDDEDGRMTGTWRVKSGKN